MTLEFKTEQHDKHHLSYGGEIEIEDFNTYYPNKNRINNQAHAMKLHWKFKKRANNKK